MSFDFHSHFEKYKHNIFLVDPKTQEEISYEKSYELIQAWSNGLKEQGVQEGDRVIVCLPNGAEFVILYFCALFMKFTLIPLPMSLNPRERSFIEKASGAKFVLYSEVTHAIIEDLSVDLKIFLPSISFHPPLNPLPSRDGEGGGDHPFLIMFTSGTTQFPKGVVHSFENMRKNALSFIALHHLDSHHRFYHHLSMSYMAGFYNLILIPFLCGASVVLEESFSPELVVRYWENAIRYHVNVLWLVPTIVSMLLKLDRQTTGQKYCRKHMEFAFIGTAPLPRILKQEFEDKYGISLFENYGLSETLFISTVGKENKDISKTVGKILSGCKVSIKEEGEISVCSEGLMLGYLNPQTTQIHSISNSDYFDTGDLGYLDEKENLYLSGRKKDLIIKGGMNISPLAIEDILMEYGKLERAVVVGIPHDIYGEEIIALLQWKGTVDSKKEIPLLQNYCLKHLNSYQIPSVFFEMDEFPTTASGKVHKEQLKKLVLLKLGI